MKDGPDKDEDDHVLKKVFPKLSVQDDKLAESYKRIKTETGSIQLDQQNDVNAEPTEQATPNPQVPAFQDERPLNVEFIARHVAAHLQGIMLFSLRMMALDAVADKSADDKNLSGNTDDDLSRLGSNQQHSLPETQEMDDIKSSLVQDEIRPRTPSVTIIIFPFRHDPDFIGHQAILNDLVSECSKPPARLALVGIGGIGKTQLAIELAYRLVKLAKMSVFWINAESRLSIEEGFKSIAWNAASWRQETDAGWLRVSYDWLSNERNGRWVLILDGANEESISHIESSLPKSQNGAIIVTTRLRDVAYRLTGGSQDVIEVGPLSVHGAVTLLEKKLGRTATERFSKFGDTSGLVKSLGLIPLAICRAAAYIQHLSPKLPIKDNDYATGNPLVDDKQYTGDRFPFGPTKSSLNKPLNVLSPKISPPDDFRPRTEELDEENSLDDTFMYEDDEDDNINDYGYVEKQLAQLRDNEQEKIKLLEFEVFSSDRSGQTLRSLFGTWKSSFDVIRSKRPSAVDLLSLMSFLIVEVFRNGCLDPPNEAMVLSSPTFLP
ncbi:hypothetical protein TrVFT333_006876 [Trichoderma virens FT-333]|nr:hypothetical protein TrVFT333_006876 [Trichoderma virens FT-333]